MSGSTSKSYPVELRERAVRMVDEIRAEHESDWAAMTQVAMLNRERPAGAPPIARCTVERLMAELGLCGAVRGKVKRTTMSDPRRRSHWTWSTGTSPRLPQAGSGLRISSARRRC